MVDKKDIQDCYTFMRTNMLASGVRTSLQYEEVLRFLLSRSKYSVPNQKYILWRFSECSEWNEPEAIEKRLNIKKIDDHDLLESDK